MNDLDKKYKFTKYACYVTYVGQAITICLSAVLFITFREMYGISYTLLGLLPFFNFFAQLSIDLIFSFFSKHFNIESITRISPVFLALGLSVYALGPLFFPRYAYFWIAFGTVIYSIAAGLAEVLVSPTVAAIPSDNPEREMSKLHSLYAWGAVLVIVVSTVFIRIFGTERWHVLALIWCIVPAVSLALFMLGKMPPMSGGISREKKNRAGVLKGIIPFVVCILLGSAAENTMSQWCSGFAEKALGLPKVIGDLLGMSLFMVMLGLARSLYAKYGKKIEKIITAGFIGATVCYLIISLVNSQAVSLAACVICGFFVSMLWPGTLIWVEKDFPRCGVAVYALLAAGGDLGGSVSPLIVGKIADLVSGNPQAILYAEKLSMTPDELGLKIAMLAAAIFPAAGVVLSIVLGKKSRPKSAAKIDQK